VCLSYIGVAIGFLGVVLIARLGPVAIDGAVFVAGIACLGAAFCYALAASYSKRGLTQSNPYASASASQIASVLLIIPFVPVAGLPITISTAAVLSILAIAVLGSALAYMIYFRLLIRLGPTRALTVTFLQPVFGITWGAMFLSERVTWAMLIGCAMVIFGTVLVLRPAKA
jgi:drug/metabolite transporter (DMT)-like permease